MKTKRIVSLALLASLLTSVSCGGTAGTSDDTTAAGGDAQTTAAVEEGYDYPDVNYNGYEFRVLNFDKYVNCSIRVDVTEQTGERLDDAIYIRNRKVEEKLGFIMNEIQHPNTAGWGTAQKELIELVSKSVMAGDDTYDAAYLNLNFNVGVMTDGALIDLNTVETLNLDEEWWDHDVNDSIEMNGKLYGASSSLQLETFDLAWVLFFNEKMMDDYGLEYPYDLVREGKWTIDKYYEYLAKAPNLNGEEAFTTWNASGKSIYGAAGHYSSAQAFMYGADNVEIVYENGKYNLNVGDERFYNTIDKLLKCNDSTGGLIRYNNGGKGNVDGYIEQFASGRAMFMTGELKTAMEERHMEDSFGLLPYPKYDEDQESYKTLVNGGSALLVVPATVKDLDRTGIILDALSYESMVSILPEYYEVTVSQKGLRNEDSIDMLKIIRETRGCEIGQFLSLTSTITSAIQNVITSGTGDAASIVASNKSAVEQKITDTLEAIG